jgi:hypothetical protein
MFERLSANETTEDNGGFVVTDVTRVRTRMREGSFEETSVTLRGGPSWMKESTRS